jgi:hypothetical protein
MYKKNKIIILFFFHFAIVSIAYWLLYKLGYKHILPSNVNVLQFDARWYSIIANQGYTYIPGVGNELAFFPLFSLIWRLSHLTPVLICLLNVIILAGGFVLLLKNEKISEDLVLILFSFPSFIFFALPYSESLFFLFGVFIILGYQKTNNVLLYIGLFGASLTRSVCMFFIPIIIICELLIVDSLHTEKQRWVNASHKILATLGGFLLASIYMGWTTGKWFYFIQIQKYWSRHWLIPKFPLTTTYPQRLLGLDGISFMFGVFAIFFCLKNFIAVYNRDKILTLNSGKVKSLLFSALFLGGMTVLDTCFTLYTRNVTNIWSLNRHVMCTPFAITFIIYFFRDFRPNVYELTSLIGLLILGVFFTGIYQYLTLAVFFFFIIFFVTFLLLKYNILSSYFAIYYIVAILLQITFYEEYLAGIWTG